MHWPPNKRLKLAGALDPKGSRCVVPWRARGVRPLLLRRRVNRPQLKRDPLGLHARCFLARCTLPLSDCSHDP